MVSDDLQELVDRALAALDVANCDMQPKGSERWRGLCPLCANRDLTLQVDLDRTRLWLDCSHASCDWRAIQEAVGLSQSDLRLDETETSELLRRAFHTLRFERPRFLVPDRVPIGGVTLLGGDPKTGKSTYTALIAAGVTSGVYGEPGVVGFVNVEDSATTVTGPRLQAAGAALELVEGLTVSAGDSERPLTLPEDVPLLEAFVQETRARLLVLDPLMAFLTERVDSNRDHGLRRALAGLQMMAERHDISILVAAHLNKDEAKRLVYRIGGTIGLVGLARSFLLFANDPNDPEGSMGDQRLLAHAASNWARRAPTLAYRIEEVSWDQDGELIVTTKLVLEGESDLTAEEMVTKRSAPTKTDRATEAILNELADGQPHPSKDVKAAVMRAISCRLDTVDRAAADLRARGVIAGSGDGPATVWYRLNEPPDSGVFGSGGGSGENHETPANGRSKLGSEKPPPDTGSPRSGGSDIGVENGQRARAEEAVRRWEEGL